VDAGLDAHILEEPTSNQSQPPALLQQSISQPTTSLHSQSPQSSSDRLIFNTIPDPSSQESDPLEHKGWVKKHLIEVFLVRVDPIFKILHRPSITLHLIQGTSYLDYEPDHPAVEALSSAIYYVSVGSLSEEECASVFSCEKKSILPVFRSVTEKSLVRVGLVTTEDITVLQAFLLYLVGVYRNYG